jgi:hypothetical protein
VVVYIDEWTVLHMLLLGTVLQIYFIFNHMIVLISVALHFPHILGLCVYWSLNCIIHFLYFYEHNSVLDLSCFMFLCILVRCVYWIVNCITHFVCMNMLVLLSLTALCFHIP